MFVFFNFHVNQVQPERFQREQRYRFRMALQSALSFYSIIAITLILIQKLAVCEEQSPLHRVYSDDVDESSCLCGLSRGILDKLESIVKTSQQDACSVSSSHSVSSSPQTSSSFQNGIAQNHLQPPSSDSRPSNLIDRRDPTESNSGNNGDNNSDNNSANQNGFVGKLTDDIKNLQAQIAQLLSNSNGNNQLKQPDDQQQQSTLSPSSAYSLSGTYGLPSISPGSLSGSLQIGLPSLASSTNSGFSVDVDPSANSNPNSGGGGFLSGIFGSSTPSQALSKLNQTQPVASADMQSAIELTVPNVVSNIFSNIQNLTIEAERQNATSNPGNGASGVLTSIDGSSVSISGSSPAQIAAQGEQLFTEWIDHQLQSLHLTVSMAAYIRRNALNLFRRIVKQYVERVEKIGGRVEDNVKRATQVALNNTQNLISFLLRNYINFAGGLMKIIGEQVSRVGKQLDSTGDTIAHTNLNPFDIVSNVIDSLPNPSRYSEYFRAFGKYLMGESSSSEQQESANNSQQDRPKGGLFSKTMGALGKTLGSWLG